MAPDMPAAVGTSQLREVYQGALSAVAMDFSFTFDQVGVRGETAVARTHTEGHNTVRATGAEVLGRYRELFGPRPPAERMADQRIHVPAPAKRGEMRAGTSASQAGGHDYVLIRADEGSSPAGSPHLFKAAAATTDRRFDFITAAFAPLTGPPLHLHHHQDDTFYVLEGILTVWAGEDIFDLEPGDFLSVPPGTPHTFDNLHNGDAAVRAINVVTPGGLFEMFDEMATLASGYDDPEAMAEVAFRHGTDILGPPLRVRLGLG